jgi:hypothetical protein
MEGSSQAERGRGVHLNAVVEGRGDEGRLWVLCRREAEVGLRVHHLLLLLGAGRLHGGVALRAMLHLMPRADAWQILLCCVTVEMHTGSVRPES